MAIHVLKIEDSLQIPNLGRFMHDNRINEKDEIIADGNTFESIDFIARHVLFLLMRECISLNRKYAYQTPLPECKIDTFKFFDNESFSKALFQETGVKMNFKALN